MASTGQISAGAYTQDAVASGVVWSNVANASVGSPVTVAQFFTLGAISNWLVGTGFAPTTPLPADASLDSVWVNLRHRRSGGTRPVLFATIEAYVSGVLKQTLTVDYVLPDVFTDTPYSLNLALLGLTRDLVNSGALKVRVSYKSGVATPPVDNNVYTGAATYVASAGLASQWKLRYNSADLIYDPAQGSAYQVAVKPSMLSTDGNYLFAVNPDSLGSNYIRPVQITKFDIPQYVNVTAAGTTFLRLTFKWRAGDFINGRFRTAGNVLGNYKFFASTGDFQTVDYPVDVAALDAGNGELIFEVAPYDMVAPNQAPGTMIVESAILMNYPAPTPPALTNSTIDVESLSATVEYTSSGGGGVGPLDPGTGGGGIGGGYVQSAKLIRIPSQGFTVL